MALALLFASNSAMSEDGAAEWLIKHLEVFPVETRSFRITMAGATAPKLCGNDYNWSYIHQGDDGHTTIVSVLLVAKMSNSEIVLYSYQNAEDNGFCKI